MPARTTARMPSPALQPDDTYRSSTQFWCEG